MPHSNECRFVCVLQRYICDAFEANADEVIVLTDAPRFSVVTIRDNGQGVAPELVRHLSTCLSSSSASGFLSFFQFARRLLVITKRRGDGFRFIADIHSSADTGGHAEVTRTFAPDLDSHGTEVKLFDLFPSTRAELASEDLWAESHPPAWHVGRMEPDQSALLEISPRLPWEENDGPRERFRKFVAVVRGGVAETAQPINCATRLDQYLQMLWTLALSVPVESFERNPLDSSSRTDARFSVFVDGMQLFRPVV